MIIPNPQRAAFLHTIERSGRWGDLRYTPSQVSVPRPVDPCCTSTCPRSHPLSLPPRHLTTWTTASHLQTASCSFPSCISAHSLHCPAEVCVFLDHHSHTPRVLLVESLPLNAQSVQGRARCSFRPPSVLLFVWPGLLLPSPLARRLALQSTRLSGFPERRDKGHAAARAWPIAQGRGDFPP